MNRSLIMLILLVPALALGGVILPHSLWAQDTQEEASDDVEKQDEAFRRRMELEDARNRDRNFADTTYEKQVTQEKIDKLPQESRENIRRQLVDVIVENGEWEPKDALEQYPYEPTEAAQADPALKQQEQEAWDEQIQKYHEREAAAFGAHRGPVPGPGSQNGERGAQGGQSGQAGQAGSEGSAGESGQSSSESREGTYQPYSSEASSQSEEISTAGVSESALDFLRNRGAQAGSPAAQPPQASPSQESQPQESPPEAATQSTETVVRGIIPISELDKLEGAGSDDEDEP